MPFVIVTGQSAKFGDSYYSGPVSAMQAAAISIGRPRDIPTVSDINAATRIPVIFKQQAEMKAKELQARIAYDDPKPVKLLKWLFSAPSR